MNAERAWQVGDTLPETDFMVTRGDLSGYARASGDNNPIHRDPPAAVRAGMPDVVAPGMLLVGRALSGLAARLGGVWPVAGCSARFLRPVVVPADTAARVDVVGAVQAVRSGRIDVRLTLRCSTAVVAVLGVEIQQQPRTSDRPPASAGAECREEAS